MKKKKVTMQLIADKAGYSKYVVSKTLNGKPGVSESTRKKILFIAKQLGYLKTETKDEIDESDRDSLSDRFVLVVMPDHRFQNIESDYWSAIFDGVVDYLEECDIGVVVISSKNNLSNSVKTSNLLGIITVGLVSTEMLLNLNKHQVPLIMIDHEDSLVKADSIFMDNVDALYKLTSYLIGLGHNNLVFVGDIQYSRSFYDRWIGFRMAMEKRDPAFDSGKNLLDISYDRDGFEGILEQIITELNLKGKLPTGFLCANDQIANHVMEVVKKIGYRIPDDISVTGFDNLEKSSVLHPPLTSVQVLKEAVGKRAVSKLLWRLKNADFPSEKVSIATDLIIRSSTGAPGKTVGK